MSLLAHLGLGSPPSTSTVADDDLVSAVRARLARLPAARAEMIAAFAGLLIRVAAADDDVSPAEAAALRRLVAARAGLGADETEAVADLVTSRLESLSGIEYSRLTRTLNEHASPEEKLQLLDCLYAIATADDLVTVVEEEQIRAVARALMLSHEQLIEVRHRYADRLEVLRDLPH
jgi:uncharacterized tellurite resistance protein B-like protein